MTLKPKGISQCQCDCMSGTCSDCFIRGYIKPTCLNCRKDFNNGTCGCDNPKRHIMKGWADNTEQIVKHTPAEKKIIKGWIDQHNKMLERSIKFYDSVWQGVDCKSCGKSFKVRGGKVELCKTCIMKMFENGDYEE